MARGSINNFFRRILPGKALRHLANVDNLNRVSNILNDIQGEGCIIEKPTDNDGRGWRIVYNGSDSDLPVRRWPSTVDVSYNTVNTISYNSEQGYFEAVNLDFRVNGVAVEIPEFQQMTFYPQDPAGEIAYLYIGLHTENNKTGFFFHTMNGFFSTDYLTVKYAKLYPGGNFEPYIEGPVNLYYVSGDTTRRPDWADYLREASDNLTIKSTPGLTFGVPNEINNFQATQSWANEWPNGRTATDPDTGERILLDPDATAVYRNSAYKALLRYRDTSETAADNHGHRRWIGLRDIAQAMRGLINERLTEDIEHYNGVIPDIQTLFQEALAKWLNEAYTPMNPYEMGSYNPVSGTWNNESPESLTKSYVLEDELLPYSAIWNGNAGRDNEGNYTGLALLIASLSTDLSGYLATWEGCKTDEASSDTDSETQATEYTSAAEGVTQMEGIYNIVSSALLELSETATDLEERMARLENEAI